MSHINNNKNIRSHSSQVLSAYLKREIASAAARANWLESLRTKHNHPYYKHAAELANMAMTTMANRTDCYGLYWPIEDRIVMYTDTNGVTKYHTCFTAKNPLILDTFVHHFQNQRPGDYCIGLHPGTGHSDQQVWRPGLGQPRG